MQTNKPVRTNLKNWSHIKIGEETSNFFMPDGYESLAKSLFYAHHNRLKPFILGGGSNVLFGNTQNYAVITDTHLPYYWKNQKKLITVTSNYNITQLIMELSRINCGGLEFLAGIPAHLGGLVKMNAGAYGHSISEYIRDLKVMDWNGHICVIDKSDVDFGYRSSGIDGVILELTLELPDISGKEIVEKARNNIFDRKKKQPVQYPNLGSIFKNPPDDYAGRILEINGYRGKTIGDMQFSNKHANFMINKGNGSFAEAMELINSAIEVVSNNNGIKLEREIIVVDK